VTPRNHPQLERGPAGFVRTSRGNLLAALESVLPAEILAKVRAGLAHIAAGRPQDEVPNGDV
jgi:hypothetical protein